MNIPDTIRIRGRTWRVVWVDDLRCNEGTKCWGLTLHGERIIALNTELADEHAWDLPRVWLHELMHACLPAKGRNRPRCVTDDAEESFIGAVDRPLLDALALAGWSR